MWNLDGNATNSHHQLIVDKYFRARVRDWEQIYMQRDLYAVIHQQRKTLVLAMVDKLGLPPDELVLEVGCGAGLTTVALARRGYSVDAVDRVGEMVDFTRRNASEAGVSHRVKTAVADINRLLLPSDHFSLVLAIGVLPWLHSTYEPMRELARVTKAGGYLIVSVDNRWRLHELLDPRLNPIHAPIRKLARVMLRRNNLHQSPEIQTHSPREFDAILQSVGYAKMQLTMLGFGPFSLLGRKVLPDSLGIKLNNFLQRYANHDIPLLRSTGAQYLVLARKQS